MIEGGEMKPICNALIARSIALVAGANRWIEKILGFQSHNHFLSRLLFRIENIVRSTTRISKDLSLDDYLTRFKYLGRQHVRI